MDVVSCVLSSQRGLRGIYLPVQCNLVLEENNIKKPNITDISMNYENLGQPRLVKLVLPI